MDALLFGAVVLVVAALWLTRRMRARAKRTRRAEGPGRTPETAIVVRSYDDIDTVVDRERCPCGYRLRVAGEGTRETTGTRVRIVRLACDDCEEMIVLHFDVTEVMH